MVERIKGPIFVKEDSQSAKQLSQLQQLSTVASAAVCEKIQADIRTLQAGIYGEDTIAFELKNSHIPMLILHDLYLVHNGLSAQIDYLILTHKHIYVLECKNLYGNIEINNNGDFIRTVSYGRRTVKEGIYSPITQNKRHLELLYKLRKEQKGNFLTKFLFDRSFSQTYRSIVVLANPKTVLNARFAKKEIKAQVIRADQLNEYIKKTDAASDDEFPDQSLWELARFFLEAHQENPVDYAKKYGVPTPEPQEISPVSTSQATPPAPMQEPDLICPKCGSPMIKRTAKKGPRAGKPFYGCSRYPNCRFIINVE